MSRKIKCILKCGIGVAGAACIFFLWRYFIWGPFSIEGLFLGEHALDLGEHFPMIDYSLMVTERKDQYNEDILILNGLPINSIVGIYKIKLHRYGDELNILAYTSFTAQSRRGDLNYRLTVPSDISVVAFGEKRNKIWSRTEGVARSPYIKTLSDYPFIKKDTLPGYPF